MCNGSGLSCFVSISDPCPIVTAASRLLSANTSYGVAGLVILSGAIRDVAAFGRVVKHKAHVERGSNGARFVIVSFEGIAHLFASPG